MRRPVQESDPDRVFQIADREMVDSFGYGFDTATRSMVISGDTAPTQSLLDHSRGCNVLIHEAYSMASYHKVSPQSQQFRRTHHTSSVELAEIANTIQPDLLIIYHRSNAGARMTQPESEDVLLEEIRQSYPGRVVASHDLDVF